MVLIGAKQHKHNKVLITISIKEFYMFGRIIILSLIINSYLKLIKLCKLNLYQEVYMKKIELVLVMILGL